MRTREERRALGIATRLLSEPPDLTALDDPEAWNLIQSHARHLGVAPLLADLALRYAPAAGRRWGESVLVRSRIFHENSLRELQLTVTALADEGIETLSLKGPLLARRYYDPPFLRKPSGDLDLAVRRKDLKRACETLVRAGYTKDVTDAEALACSHHILLRHPVRPPVELHFRLSHGPMGPPVDEFFDRAVTFSFPGGTARVMSPADELFHLILHLAHERFRPLFYLYELRRVWQAASEEVRQNAIARAFYGRFACALALTDAGFRLRWGQSFLPHGMPPAVTWLGQTVDERLYSALEDSAGSGGHTLASRIRGRMLQLQIADRPGDAARLLGLMGRIAWFEMFRPRHLTHLPGTESEPDTVASPAAVSRSNIL